MRKETSDGPSIDTFELIDANPVAHRCELAEIPAIRIDGVGRQPSLRVETHQILFDGRIDTPAVHCAMLVASLPKVNNRGENAGGQGIVRRLPDGQSVSEQIGNWTRVRSSSGGTIWGSLR
mgnify:CR=1 FL=1